jgi:putative hydrolase of the HAD superfamily
LPFVAIGKELMLPKAILFDLDDTILMDDVLVEECWRAACAEYAPRVPGCSADVLYDAIRAYADWYWSDPDRHREGRLDLVAARRVVVTEALARLGVTDPELGREIADTYSHEKADRARPFPGAIETLEALLARGMRMALLTNGGVELQYPKIERYGLRRFFPCIVIEGEFGCGKPDERVFLHALRELGVEARDAWMVGDRLAWEIDPAQRLGMTGVWVDVHGTGLPADPPAVPDRIVRSIAELRP